jgi:hypothetical protein
MQGKAEQGIACRAKQGKQGKSGRSGRESKAGRARQIMAGQTGLSKARQV